VLPGVEISRRHAEFQVEGAVFALRDLNSRNGTFVNALRQTEAFLAIGDVVRCGEWVGIIAEEGEQEGFGEIAPGWYGGPTLSMVAEPARRIAADLPIIVQGETGTGKEGMARAIHGWSKRGGAFVAVNCAALPPHLAEAELFGYRKGAFTGADRASTGLFRAAHGGTLFLDELLELPASVQPKLLRVLEQQEVLPLGETTPVPIEVRVVAATQESLTDAVAEGHFRADLHARLDGLTVILPPLRGRREDIAPLCLAFLREHSRGQPPEVEPKLMEAFCLYDWPLNVRELLLLVRRLVGLFGHERVLKKTHLPERILRKTPGNASHPSSHTPKREWRRLNDEAEIEALLDSLRTHGGSVARAAAALGISRARGYRLLSAHTKPGPDEDQRDT
jgi:two-component system response regulator FlrC